ncbi:hypothetical protein UVI_02015320 [Ustilaginoidea virens]|uniref:5'-3' DNA helicase ZGRF1-like N-terminal domain-containing protein n=1 Tax=Ustilaginoidea virens TaxID=1159556 RepID=A0A1B5KRZ5_USTVR|nr:hypothetical protein UVI_02015320 [Ustilaginoidea virens]
MSYAVRGTTSTAPAGSSGEAAATTATVRDYVCLFTHDLKRKQKRWQDGKLKYHTFNKRIMVYDDRGNFIGDGHWPAGGDLEEGEELQLDRGAAMVQVADCVGSREQDLTELLDRRAREVEKRRAVAAAKTPTPGRAGHRQQQQQQPRPQDRQRSTHFQLNHRPLSRIVRSPGPIGRAAVPARSPYEARNGNPTADARPAPPPAKKRRTSPSPPSKTGFAQSLFGARLNLSTCPVAVSTLRSRLLKEKTHVQEAADAAAGLAAEEDDVVALDEGPKAKQPPTQRLTRGAVDTSFAKGRTDAEQRAVSGERDGLHLGKLGKQSFRIQRQEPPSEQRDDPASDYKHGTLQPAVVVVDDGEEQPDSTGTREEALVGASREQPVVKVAWPKADHGCRAGKFQSAQLSPVAPKQSRLWPN